MSDASTAAAPLPPTPRDFDILRMSRVCHMSTRRIADKHGISQTRVRQVIYRTCQWLAANLPARTEAETEADARLAQHLAAAELQQQIEQLETWFDATGDPKYLRHQTRVITALARLGVVPGAIDSLSADLVAGPLTGHEPQAPWSEDDPFANQRSTHDANDLVTRVPPGKAPPLGSSLADAPDVGCISEAQCTTDEAEWAPPAATSAATHPDLCPPTPNPPPEACSPPSPAPNQTSANPPTLSAPTADPDTPSDESTTPLESEFHAVQILERRLLTMLEHTPDTDTDRRRYLDERLASLRDRRASLELRLSPNIPSAAIQSLTPHHSHLTPHTSDL